MCYVFNRGEHPLIVFDRDGRFLRSWGEGLFVRPHGIIIGPDDTVYLHRRLRSHRPQVHARRPAAADARHAAASHRTPGRRASTIRTIQRARPAVPLSDEPGARRRTARSTSPTATATPASTSSSPTAGCSSPGASRAPDPASSTCRTASPSIGRAPSTSPIARTAALQLFSPRGQVPDRVDRRRPAVPGVHRRRTATCYVAELGYRAGMWPGHAAAAAGRRPAAASASSTARASCRPAGAAATIPDRPGDFFAPHDIWVDRTATSTSAKS